jgi:hypothetical protein
VGGGGVRFSTRGKDQYKNSGKGATNVDDCGGEEKARRNVEAIYIN